MAARKAAFHQSDLTKVLKAFRDAGQPAPQIVIEPSGRITARPVTDAPDNATQNPWDQP